MRAYKQLKDSMVVDTYEDHPHGSCCRSRVSRQWSVTQWQIINPDPRDAHSIWEEDQQPAQQQRP